RPVSVWTSTRIKVASVLISCAVQLGCGRGIDRGYACTAVIFTHASFLRCTPVHAARQAGRMWASHAVDHVRRQRQLEALTEPKAKVEQRGTATALRPEIHFAWRQKGVA